MKISPKTQLIKIKGIIVELEEARTALQRAKGLMFRKSLDQNKGMLFVFSKETKPTFWMMGVRFPLDIIWIDKNFQILEIKKNARVYNLKNLETLKTYTPKEKIKYVLEVNSGFCENKNIKKGNKISVEL